MSNVRATWLLGRGPCVTRMLGAVTGCEGDGAGVCTDALGVGRAVGRVVGCGVGRGVGRGVADGHGVPGAVGLAVAGGVATGVPEGAGPDGLTVHAADAEAPGGLLVGACEAPGVGLGEGAAGPVRLPTARPATASATSHAIGVLAALWST